MKAVSARRVLRPIRTFHDRYGWIGPLIWTLSAFYFLAQIIVGWVWNHPSYSLVQNTISDLGNTACGKYGGSIVCSPRYVLMNLSFALLGVALFVGSYFIFTEFKIPEKWARRAVMAGFVALAIGGLGAVFVGGFPENTNGVMHATGAGLAIGGGNLGILILGFALRSLPERLRQFMVLSSSIAIVAAISFAFGKHFGLGAGGMERIAAYPEAFWLIRFGLYISRDHYSKATRAAASVTQPNASP